MFWPSTLARVSGGNHPPQGPDLPSSLLRIHFLKETKPEPHVNPLIPSVLSLALSLPWHDPRPLSTGLVGKEGVRVLPGDGVEEESGVWLNPTLCLRICIEFKR